MSNQKLRQARKQRHWTQEQASARIGVAIGTYRRWESGTQLPHLSTLALVCEAFNMSDCDLGFPEDLFLQPAESDKSAAPIQTEAEQQNRQIPGIGQSLYTFADEQQIAAFASLLRLGESIMFDSRKRQTLQALLFTLSQVAIRPEGLLQPESWQPLLSPETTSAKVNEETIQGFAKLIQACWQFSRGNELAMAEKLLPECMTQLITLAQQPSKHQPSAAGLVAQGYQLYSVLALHHNDLSTSELYCKQAVQYSFISGNKNILVPSLRRLADTYRYLGQYPRLLQTYLEALQYTEKASPLLQSCIYRGLAVAYAHMDQKQEALTYLSLAKDTFPDHPEADPSFYFAEFDRPWLIMGEGIVRSKIGQTKQALDTFSRIDQPDIIVPERIRLEIINQQAKSAIIAGDLEQGSAYVETGVIGAKSLGSQRRHSEAYDNFKRITLLWPQERRAKELRELFV